MRVVHKDCPLNGRCTATVEDFDRLMAVNARSTFLCSILAAPLLREAHDPAIVNISSIGAIRAFRGAPAYVAGKGAVEAVTRALALDLAPYGIRVNAVAPGMVRSTAWSGITESEDARRSQLIPLGRAGEPGEIAEVVAFLASERASYITGQVLGADGGLSIQAYTPADEIPLLPEAS